MSSLAPGRMDGRKNLVFLSTSRQKFLKGLESNIICINTTVLHRRYGGFECQNYSMTLSFAERQDKTIPGDHASFVFHFFKGHKNISQSNRHHYQAIAPISTLLILKLTIQDRWDIPLYKTLTLLLRAALHRIDDINSNICRLQTEGYRV